MNVEVLLSDPTAILPPLSERREAVCNDPSATARAWDRVMASVLQALMGYDTSTQTASPEAVLRIINAYLAMAEGRGNKCGRQLV